MSASDNGPDGRKERHRRGVTFLRAARHLPELTPAQIDRIERHLNRAHPLRARRPILSPALAALVVVLAAGAALAVAGVSLTRLPGIGPWIGALFRNLALYPVVLPSSSDPALNLTIDNTAAAQAPRAASRSSKENAT